jgi:predicted nucleic acid-binding protein
VKEADQRLVLDASATLPLLLKTASTSVTKITEALLQATVVFVPTLHGYEVANALWKYVAAGQLSANDAQRALSQSSNLAAEVDFDQDLLQEALAIANHHRHPVYDSAYVALARRKTAALLTLDRRLKALADAAGIRIVTL